jgi:phage terminase large subunit-like protein
MWTEQSVRWINLETWDRCKGLVPWQQMDALHRGRKCFGGADLSQTVDLTALCYVFPPDDEFEHWAAIWRYFIPRARIENRVRRDKVPYDLWEKAGALQTTDGNVVDYSFVKAQIEADAELFQIERMGFDPFNAMQLMLQLQGEGLPVEQVRQGYLTLSGPTKELERLTLDEAISHGGHPVSRWCAGNVAVETDAAGNIKPSKAKSTERIDGVAAAVTALALAIQNGVTVMAEPEIYFL